MGVLRKRLTWRDSVRGVWKRLRGRDNTGPSPYCTTDEESLESDEVRSPLLARDHEATPLERRPARRMSSILCVVMQGNVL